MAIYVKPVNNVINLTPEKAQEVLCQVVDLCVRSNTYDLTTHSEAWDILVSNGAINITDTE